MSASLLRMRSAQSGRTGDDRAEHAEAERGLRSAALTDSKTDR